MITRSQGLHNLLEHFRKRWHTEYLRYRHTEYQNCKKKEQEDDKKREKKRRHNINPRQEEITCFMIGFKGWKTTAVER